MHFCQTNENQAVFLHDGPKVALLHFPASSGDVRNVSGLMKGGDRSVNVFTVMEVAVRAIERRTRRDPREDILQAPHFTDEEMEATQRLESCSGRF